MLSTNARGLDAENFSFHDWLSLPDFRIAGLRK